MLTRFEKNQLIKAVRPVGDKNNITNFECHFFTNIKRCAEWLGVSDASVSQYLGGITKSRAGIVVTLVDGSEVPFKNID